jgi:hypothetical protein
MAKLADCEKAVREALEEYSQAASAYEKLRATHRQLSEHPEGVFESGLLGRMTFQIGELQVPVPFPGDRDKVLDLIADAAEAVGVKIHESWEQMHKHTAAAVEHCHEAAERATTQLSPGLNGS